jgi:hypothetical protein
MYNDIQVDMCEDAVEPMNADDPADSGDEKETQLSNLDNLTNGNIRRKFVYKNKLLDHIEIITERNIHTYVKRSDGISTRELRFLAFQAISHLNEFDKLDRHLDPSVIEIYITAAASQLVQYHVSNHEEDPQLYMLAKNMFDRFIRELGYNNLIRYYNMIFNDSAYDTTADTMIDEGPQITLSAEWKAEKIKEYQLKQLQIARRKAMKRPKINFKAGSYVGAQDREGNWWLSKILAIFTHEEHIIYYVEFLQWGEQFNEFIADLNRIRKYNPRFHHLFKPAEV